MEIIYTLVNYCIYGIEPTSQKAHVQLAFNFAKPLIDKNIKRYLAKVERQRKDDTQGEHHVNTMSTQCKHDENIVLGVDDNDDVNVDVDTSRRINPSSSDSNDSDDAVAVSKKEKAEESKRVMTLIDYYNTTIVKNSSQLRSCQSLSPKRRGMVLARLKEHGEEKVRLVVDKAVASDFLNYTKKGGPADIEWIMGPENFGKILEGKYDNGNYSRSQAEGDPKNVNSKWGK